jgi:hypothetical protein
MFSGNIADMTVTLVAFQPGTEIGVTHYRLVVADYDPRTRNWLDTSRVFESENEAIRAFCAIVCSDEPDLTSDCERLRKVFGAHMA